MRIASNNQWKYDVNTPEWAAIGEDCSAEVRVKGLLRAYSEIQPDILGLQEVSLRMTELMLPEMKHLPFSDGTFGSYELITGGDTPIWFRNDRLKLLESGFFRFPEQIEDWEGSFNNGGTKSYTYGIFEEAETGKKLALASVHLWWKSTRPDAKNYQPRSNEARAWQIALVAEKMEKISDQYDIPAFILGDFNASVNSLCLETVVARGWKDVHDLSVGETDQTKGHHYCKPVGFAHEEPGRFEEAIDHIILHTKRPVPVQDFLRHTPLYFDKISDHFPLYADISL